jgi:hypothetical protein
VPDIEIPSWMDACAPGAADAARQIWADQGLSQGQRERLMRLASDATRSAWRELPRRHKSKRKLSVEELRSAQDELMWEAYRAVDFRPIGRSETDRLKAKLEKIGTDAEELAHNISETGNDIQVEGLWRIYRKNRRTDDLLIALPDDIISVAGSLKRVGDFFGRAAPLYKPEGPVPHVGQPQDTDALKTTVIRQIAKTCKSHFGTVLYSTVATLANASLGRADITRISVRGSLRNAN